MTPARPAPDLFRFWENPATSRIFLLLGAFLLLVAVWLSCRVAGYDFLALGDDDINVTLNPYLGHLTLGRWAWLLTDTSYVRRFMPFGWLTLCTLFEFNGLDPFYYHIAAFTFYILNVVLVYVAAAHVLRVFVPSAAAGLDRWQVFASFLAAAWWAFHPLRVESTAWISGLLYGQGATFYLLAAIAYLRSYLCLEGGYPRWPLIALAVAALTASLLTYPIALGLAVQLLVMDYYFWSTHPAGQRVPFGRLAREKLLFLAPVAAILSFTTLARMKNPAIWGSVPTFAEFPLFQRSMQAAYVGWYYVWRPLYPLRLPPITSTLMGFNPWSPLFVFSLLALLGLSALAFLRRRTNPGFAAVWLVYLAAIGPFIGFTEHPYYVSDRYAYLSTMVMAWAFAISFSALATARAREIAAVLVLGLVVVLGVTTNHVLRIWSSPRVMFTYLVGSIPPGEEHGRIVSRFAMYEYLYGNDAVARNRIDQCVRDFPASDEIRKVQAQIEEPSGRVAPEGQKSPIAFMHLQMALYFLHSHQPVEAEAQLKRSLALDPGLFQADYNLAVLYASEGRPRPALAHYLLAEAHARGSLSAGTLLGCLRLIQQSAQLAADEPLERALERRLQ